MKQVVTENMKSALADSNPNKKRMFKVLEEVFAFKSFRGIQEDAIISVLSGQDSLVILPTGGGKSLCYALPAVMLSGISLIISPLISLMEDQVTALQKKGIRAEFLSESKRASERAQILAGCEEPLTGVKVLFATPELVTTSTFLQWFKKLYLKGCLSLIAIDEAHCISSWGHDFRSSYRNLSRLRETASSIPIIALTATANTTVKDDIMSSLKLRSPRLFQASFNRPNIYYEVRPYILSCPPVAIPVVPPCALSELLDVFNLHVTAAFLS